MSAHIYFLLFALTSAKFFEWTVDRASHLNTPMMNREPTVELACKLTCQHGEKTQVVEKLQRLYHCFWLLGANGLSYVVQKTDLTAAIRHCKEKKSEFTNFNDILTQLSQNNTFFLLHCQFTPVVFQLHRDFLTYPLIHH